MTACTKTQDISDCDRQISNAVMEIAEMPVERKIAILESKVDQSCWQTEHYRVNKIEYLAMNGELEAAKDLLDSFDMSRTQYRQRIELILFGIAFNGPQESDPDDKKAFQHANGLISNYPQSFEGYILRGAVFARRDNFEESLSDYKAARALAKTKDEKLFEALEIYYADLFNDHGLHKASYRIVRSRLDK